MTSHSRSASDAVHSGVESSDLEENDSNRRGVDRRKDHYHAFIGQFYRGRRVIDRRKDARGDGYYVDRHEPWLIAVVLVTMVLCVADVYNTLVILKHGGEEINPVMDILIQTDKLLFFTVKYAVTGLCLLILIMHKNYRFLGVIRVYYLIFACLFIYCALMIYQLGLLSLIPESVADAWGTINLLRG